MITIKWGREDKSILQYEFEGTWAIDDLIHALDEGVKVTSKYDHHIDVLVDLTHSGFPDLFGTNIVNAFNRAMNRTEEHIEDSGKEPGIIVVISKNNIIRSTLSTLLTMYKKMGDRIAIAEDQAQALALIDQFHKSAPKNVLSA